MQNENPGIVAITTGNTQELQAAPRSQVDAPEKIYSIAIRQVDHGYIIEVGCKTFVIESAERLAGLISAYLLKPAEIFEKYCKGNLL